MNLKITLVRSPIGYDRSQLATAKALGIGRIGRSAVHADTPPIRGMIRKISHLVRVEETNLPTRAKQRHQAPKTQATASAESAATAAPVAKSAPAAKAVAKAPAKKAPSAKAPLAKKPATKKPAPKAAAKAPAKATAKKAPAKKPAKEAQS